MMIKKVIKLKKNPVGRPPEKLDVLAERADNKALKKIGKKIDKATENKTESGNSQDNIKKVQEYYEFLYWMATPIDLRIIKTRKEFAKKIGVDNNTLTTWSRREGFSDQLADIIRTLFRERASGVLRAVERRALGTGGSQDAALFFKATGMIKDQTDLKLGIDEDLKKALDKVSKALPD